MEDDNNKISDNELLIEQFKFINLILNKIKKLPNAVPFSRPVDPIALNIPDYSNVIKHPMDLSTIRRKLDKKKYEKVSEVFDDFKLMVNNCYIYNGRDSPISEMAKDIETVFDSNWASLPMSLHNNNITHPVKVIKKSESPITPSSSSSATAAANIEETRKVADLIMTEIEKAKHKRVTWLFMHPVIDEEAPGYSSVVSNPMDLTTLRSKVDNNYYKSLIDFNNDLDLIADNCKLYNSPTTEYYKIGINMEKLVNNIRKDVDNKISNKLSGGGGRGGGYEDSTSIESVRSKISELMVKLSEMEKDAKLSNNSDNLLEDRHKIFTIPEREELASSIIKMSKDECDNIVEMIQRSSSKFSYVSADEIEVDFLTLSDLVIGEISEFVKKVTKKAEGNDRDKLTEDYESKSE